MYTVSPSRNYIAIAEESSETGIISIYEIKKHKDIKLKKKRTILSTELDCHSFSRLEFLPQNEKYLISLTDGPEYKLCLWEWEKGKLKTVLKINGFKTINGMFFADKEDSLLFCYGNPIYKNFSVRSFFVKIENDHCFFNQKFDIVKDFLKNYSKNFISHNILADNQIIFGNSTGEILILNKQYELKKKLQLETETPEQVTNLISWGEGFLATGEQFKLYEYQKNSKDINYPYSYSGVEVSLHDYENSGIVSMIPINQNKIIAGLSTGEFVYLEIAPKEKDQKLSLKLSHVLDPFHVGRINDIAVCKKKPLIATCG